MLRSLVPRPGSRLQSRPARQVQRSGSAAFAAPISSGWRARQLHVVEVGVRGWGVPSSASGGTSHGLGGCCMLVVVCKAGNRGAVVCEAVRGRYGVGGVANRGSAGRGRGHDWEGVKGRGGASARREEVQRSEGQTGSGYVRGYETRGGTRGGRGGRRHPEGRGAWPGGSTRGGGAGRQSGGGREGGGRGVRSAYPEQLAGMTGTQLFHQLFNMARSSVPVPAEQWEGVLVEIGRGGAARLRECTPKNLALMANAVVKLAGPRKVGGHVLAGVVVIDQAAVTLVLDGTFPHQNCSMLAYNFAKLGYYDALWFLHLAKVAGARDWAGINPQNIVNMVYAYALAGHRDEMSRALVDDMIVAALPQLQDFKPQDTANLVWALAKLGHSLSMPQLLERAAAALPGMGELDASSLLHLLLERGAMHQLGSCTTQNLANLLWACGQLRDQHGGGLKGDGAHVRALVGQLVRDADKCQSQHISNVFLGAVALGHPMQQQDVDTLVRALVDKGGRAGAQHIANTIWACATARYAVQEQQLQRLVRALAGMVVRTPGRVVAQNVSNTLWGCATMGCSISPEDCGALVGWLVQNITSCNPQGVANSVWAISKLQPASSSTRQLLQPSTVRLLEALPAFVEANRAGFIPQGISNIAWAAATIEYHVPGLMAVLVSAARPQLQAFNSQDMANLVWALAVLEPMESQQVFREVERTVAGMLGCYTAQEVSNTAWAYAVVLGQLVDRQLAIALLQRAGEVQSDLLPDHKCQLYSLVLLLPAEVAASLQPEVQRLVEECRTAYVAAAKQSAASQVQQQVFQVLSSFGTGLQLEMEHVAEGGLFCIDIALDPEAGPGQRVAVEVDGPTHHTRSRPHRELGHTVLRRRLQERYGWRVVSVLVLEWRVQRDKAGYLKGLLGMDGT